MATTENDHQEGSLKPPKHLDWQNPEFRDEALLFVKLDRVYDICHGCRRCFNLRHAFPTLFNLVDQSETIEVNHVAEDDH